MSTLDPRRPSFPQRPTHPGPAPFPPHPPRGHHPGPRPGPRPGGPALSPPPALAAPPRQPREPRRRSLGTQVVAGVLAAGIVLGGVWALGSGTSGPTVQPLSSAGDAPTTAPVGADVTTVAASSATGPQDGDSPDLYASSDPASCDGASLLSQLEADPAKAAAWAAVFGVDAGDLPAFVGSLSPVVLRAATAVTDHPYRDGAFVQEPAVLAAGTAVLIDSYGTPTVKCLNGNPLTAGEEAAGAVVVRPTRTAITRFQFTSVDNGRPVVVTAPRPQTGPNPGGSGTGGTGTGGTGTGGTGTGGTGSTTTTGPDPALAARAAELRETADSARTRANIAQGGLNSLRTDLGVLREDQNRLIRESQDPTKTPAEQQAARDQLNLLSQRIVDKQKELTQAAQDLDTAEEAAREADAAAKDAERARDESVRPRPAGQPVPVEVPEPQTGQAVTDEQAQTTDRTGTDATTTGDEQTGGTPTTGEGTGTPQTGGEEGTPTGGEQSGEAG